MRRILCGAVAIAMSATALAVRADEPRRGIIGRGREVVQACFHKHRGSCNEPCRTSCNPCGQHDVRIGKLIDTLFYAERACDRKNAALRLDEYNWTQHPEIVTALTYAMQSDCERSVRIAAADSLKDMRVSDPDSIGAMQFTRHEDPSCRVRYKAKWGIIKGERHRPPCLTYVSGYGPATRNGDEPEPGPTPIRQRLEPTPAPNIPAPETKPDVENPSTEARRGLRSVFSNAMAKVRSRS